MAGSWTRIEVQSPGADDRDCSAKCIDSVNEADETRATAWVSPADLIVWIDPVGVELDVTDYEGATAVDRLDAPETVEKAG